MAALTISELSTNVSNAVSALAVAVSNNPGPLPPGECEKIVAAIAALQAVYRDNCNGGV